MENIKIKKAPIQGTLNELDLFSEMDYFQGLCELDKEKKDTTKFPIAFSLFNEKKGRENDETLFSKRLRRGDVSLEEIKEFYQRRLKSHETKEIPEHPFNYFVAALEGSSYELIDYFYEQICTIKELPESLMDKFREFIKKKLNEEKGYFLSLRRGESTKEKVEYKKLIEAYILLRSKDIKAPKLLCECVGELFSNDLDGFKLKSKEIKNLKLLETKNLGYALYKYKLKNSLKKTQKHFVSVLSTEPCVDIYYALKKRVSFVDLLSDVYPYCFFARLKGYPIHLLSFPLRQYVQFCRELLCKYKDDERCELNKGKKENNAKYEDYFFPLIFHLYEEYRDREEKEEIRKLANKILREDDFIDYFRKCERKSIFEDRDVIRFYLLCGFSKVALELFIGEIKEDGYEEDVDDLRI
jgi:hypothetical protein